MGWWRVWTTNDTKRGERRERVSWAFACFVIQSTDAQMDGLVYELYGLMEEEIGEVEATDGS